MADHNEKKPPKAGAEEAAQPAKAPRKAGAVRVRRTGGSSELSKESRRLEDAAVTKVPVDMTDKLSAGERAGLPGYTGLAFGADPGAARFYRKLPLNLGTANLPAETPRWRIELEGLGPGVEPVGLDILGDAVLGRGRIGNQAVDFDLDPYGGLEQGVSRRHALLRPTANHLYVIDLGSTNGTMHNGLPLGPGITRSLKHNDTITLGRLSFNIKIIDGPTSRRPPAPPMVEGDSEPTRRLDQETPTGLAVPYVGDTRTSMPKVSPEMIEARRKDLATDKAEEPPNDDSSPDKPANAPKSSD